MAPAATNQPILNEAVLGWWLRVPSLAWEERNGSTRVQPDGDHVLEALGSMRRINCVTAHLGACATTLSEQPRLAALIAPKEVINADGHQVWIGLPTRTWLGCFMPVRAQTDRGGRCLADG